MRGFLLGIKMAKPRIFISSTYFDFKNVRDDLDRYIKTLGYEAVRHEAGHVPYEKTHKLDQSCYKEIENCDILICLIGGRFGSTASGSEYSITQKELKTALEAGKQIYIFIDAPVYHEQDFYQDNKGSTETKYRHATNIKVHQFIEEISSLNQGNVIFPFNTTSEIIKILQEQWAGLFQRLLLESSKSVHANMAAELKQSLQAANKIIDHLSKQKDTDNTVISQIISTNHPIFSSLRKALSIPYRIYFETKEELEQWLKVRGYSPVNPEAWDNPNHFEWINSKPQENFMWLLKIKNNLFDDNGKILPANSASWDESSVTHERRNDDEGTSDPFDDDIPF